MRNTGYVIQLKRIIIPIYDGGVSEGQQEGVARSPPQERRGNFRGMRSTTVDHLAFDLL